MAIDLHTRRWPAESARRGPLRQGLRAVRRQQPGQLHVHQQPAHASCQRQQALHAQRVAVHGPQPLGQAARRPAQATATPAPHASGPSSQRMCVRDHDIGAKIPEASTGDGADAEARIHEQVRAPGLASGSCGSDATSVDARRLASTCGDDHQRYVSRDDLRQLRSSCSRLATPHASAPRSADRSRDHVRPGDALVG